MILTVKSNGASRHLQNPIIPEWPKKGDVHPEELDEQGIAYSWVHMQKAMTGKYPWENGQTSLDEYSKE